MFCEKEDLLYKKLILFFVIDFVLGFSFSSYQVVQDKQRKEKAEIQLKVDRFTVCATKLNF